MLALSPWWGNVIATYRLQRAVSELAYLRDQKAAGALDDARGLKPYWKKPQPAYLTSWAPPVYPGPAGIGGQLPAPAMVSPPLGSAPTQSVVDPRWGPPKA